MGSHLWIFTPCLCNLGYKKYVEKPQMWQLIRVSDIGSNLDLEHISIDTLLGLGLGLEFLYV